MQASRDKGLHRLSLWEILSKMSGVVNGLFDCGHDFYCGRGIKGHPLIRKPLLNSHLINLSRVELTVDKVTLVARCCIGDVCAEDDMVKCWLSFSSGRLKDGLEKV